MFRPDEPIESAKQDLLGRATFAQALGKAILSYQDKNSVVIGLFGEWGCGKTSIVNMALEHIHKASTKRKKTKPIIVRFNPWNFSGQEQLISQFFRTLSFALRRADYAGKAKEAGEKLERYAKFFVPIQLVPVFGQAAGVAKKAMEITGSVAKAWGELKESDLDGAKKELDKLLATQPNKIIVVMDDIDRLSSAEIRQMFQLIKSLGDFRNTVYLVAFDKNVVLKALENVQEDTGEAYLEKIVQVPFDVPLISKQEVEALLFNHLNDLVRDIPEDKWDDVRWANVYRSGLTHFFKSIRHVKRYINSLAFSFGPVKREVNAVDFLAITAIEVFLPDLYYAIRDNKDIFTGVFKDEITGNHLTGEQARKRCDEIINRVTEPPGDVLKDFLARLFPKLHSIYENTSYGYESLGQWRRQGRICSPDSFDTYFGLAIPEGEIPISEMETVLGLAQDADALSHALLALNEDGRISRFLERVEDYTDAEIPQEHIEPIITVLMDLGDLFPIRGSERFATDTPLSVLRISHQLIDRVENEEERFEVFRRAIEKAVRSLYTSVREVSAQVQQHRELTAGAVHDPQEKPTASAEQLEQFKSLACEKIDTWASSGQLGSHRHLSWILFPWRDWAGSEKPGTFVRALIKSDSGLVHFVSTFLSELTTFGASDYAGKKSWQIHLKSIKEFVDPKKIEPRLRGIADSPDFDKLSEVHKIGVTTFLDTIDGKIKEPGRH